jgi:hypothetical protein
MSQFEANLWSELVDAHGANDVVPAQPSTHRWRPAHVVTTGAVGLGAAAVALILGLGATTSTPLAYAVTRNADGTLNLTPSDIANVPALNAEFAKLGVAIRAVPISATCPLHDDNWSNAWPGHTMSEKVVVGINPQPGYAPYVAATQVPNGTVELNIGAVKGPRPTCFSEDTAPGTPTIPGVPAAPGKVIPYQG